MGGRSPRRASKVACRTYTAFCGSFEVVKVKVYCALGMLWTALFQEVRWSSRAKFRTHCRKAWVTTMPFAPCRGCQYWCHCERTVYRRLRPLPFFTSLVAGTCAGILQARCQMIRAEALFRILHDVDKVLH